MVRFVQLVHAAVILLHICVVGSRWVKTGTKSKQMSLTNIIVARINTAMHRHIHAGHQPAGRTRHARLHTTARNPSARPRTGGATDSTPPIMGMPNVVTYRITVRSCHG